MGYAKEEEKEEKPRERVTVFKHVRNALKAAEEVKLSVFDFTKVPTDALDALDTMRNAIAFANLASMLCSLPYLLYALVLGMTDNRWSAWMFTILFHVCTCISLKRVSKSSPKATDAASFLQRAKFRIEQAVMCTMFYAVISALVWVHTTMHVHQVTPCYVNFISINSGMQMGLMISALLFFVHGAFDYIESALIKPKVQ